MLILAEIMPPPVTTTDAVFLVGRSLSQSLVEIALVILVAMSICRVALPSLFFKVYRRVAKVTQHKYIKSFCAILTVLVGGYYTVKKAFGWSLSATLDTIFHSNVATHVSFFLLCVIIGAVVINAFNIWFEHNPPDNVQKIEPEGISKCILRINNELERHLEKIEKDNALVRSRFADGHSFDENIGLIVESLADHAVGTLKGFKARRRDIFVSVYLVPDFQNPSADRKTLEYLTHYPPNRDNVGTKRIALDDPAYKEFACVRCINGGQEFISSLSCTDYARGSGKRTKSLKHYLGFAIKADGRLLGFINIELHNETFFLDQDQLESYAETHLIIFKYLVAHQFLKAMIYRAIENNLPVRPKKFSPQTSTT